MFEKLNKMLAEEYEQALAAFKEKDYKTAIEKWKSCSRQGEANAPGNLGVLYHEGKFVTQDYAEAVRWYKLA